MKRRILLGILAAALILGGLILWFMAVGSLSVSAGRVLVADNGSVMLIKDGSPIVLSNQGGEGMLDGLAAGDQILVLHDGIQESYPAHTGAYFVIRQGGGTIDDIPVEVRDTLREMGWIS